MATYLILLHHIVIFEHVGIHVCVVGDRLWMKANQQKFLQNQVTQAREQSKNKEKTAHTLEQLIIK